ncbi:hypothetical protein J2X05_001921 [Cellvibrio fibrivorans]|uniref:Uncharacterized protein n=1 Tax=Cellvibrio fibrivorans TaxID=126350 RepID=A0ABU1UXH4_9GAMM|nr:hypothetical protein [Cellvibrio fibrivorans]
MHLFFNHYFRVSIDVGVIFIVFVSSVLVLYVKLLSNRMENYFQFSIQFENNKKIIFKNKNNCFSYK